MTLRIGASRPRAATPRNPTAHAIPTKPMMPPMPIISSSVDLVSRNSKYSVRSEGNWPTSPGWAARTSDSRPLADGTSWRSSWSPM